jgi:hypothetical protein
VRPAYGGAGFTDDAEHEQSISPSSRETKLPHSERSGQSRYLSGFVGSQRLAQRPGREKAVPYTRPLNTAIDRSNAKPFPTLELFASDEEAQTLYGTSHRQNAAEPNVPWCVWKPFSEMKKMNAHVSLLLQGYAAERKLAEIFQSEGLGLADKPPIGLPPTNQFLQSRQTSNKVANCFEKTVASTDLFLIGYQLRYEPGR